jgi:hypothetical protein
MVSHFQKVIHRIYRAPTARTERGWSDRLRMVGLGADCTGCLFVSSLSSKLIVVTLNSNHIAIASAQWQWPHILSCLSRVQQQPKHILHWVRHCRSVRLVLHFASLTTSDQSRRIGHLLGEQAAQRARITTSTSIILALFLACITGMFIPFTLECMSLCRI